MEFDRRQRLYQVDMGEDVGQLYPNASAGGWDHRGPAVSWTEAADNLWRKAELAAIIADKAAAAAERAASEAHWIATYLKQWCKQCRELDAALRVHEDEEAARAAESEAAEAGDEAVEAAEPEAGDAAVEAESGDHPASKGKPGPVKAKGGKGGRVKAGGRSGPAAAKAKGWQGSKYGKAGMVIGKANVAWR